MPGTAIAALARKSSHCRPGMRVRRISQAIAMPMITSISAARPQYSSVLPIMKVLSPNTVA